MCNACAPGQDGGNHDGHRSDDNAAGGPRRRPAPHAGPRGASRRRRPRAPDRADHEPAGLGPRPHRGLRGPLARAPPRRTPTLLRPDLAALYDAFETPRAVRGDLEILDYDERRWPTCRPCARGPRTRCSTHGVDPVDPRDGPAARAPAHRDDAPGDGDRRPAAAGRAVAARRSRAPSATTGCDVPAGTHALGAPADRFSYDNERPLHAVDVAGFQIARRPVTNGDVDALRRGRRLRPPRVVVGRGLGVEGGVRHHAPRERDGRAP